MPSRQNTVWTIVVCVLTVMIGHKMTQQYYSITSEVVVSKQDNPPVVRLDNAEDVKPEVIVNDKALEERANGARFVATTPLSTVTPFNKSKIQVLTTTQEDKG